jgi:hypothetical protein
VVREGVGAGGRNEPSLTLYAHMNNKRKMKKKREKKTNLPPNYQHQEATIDAASSRVLKPS